MTLEGTITRTNDNTFTGWIASLTFDVDIAISENPHKKSKSPPNPRATVPSASGAPGTPQAKLAMTTSPSPSTLAQVKSVPTRSRPRTTVNIASSPTQIKTSGAGIARAFHPNLQPLGAQTVSVTGRFSSRFSGDGAAAGFFITSRVFKWLI